MIYGINDSVSKLWLLRRDNGLDLTGYKDEVEAIDHLVRCALLKDVTKEQIQEVVTKALTYKPRERNCHADDCDCADCANSTPSAGWFEPCAVCGGTGKVQPWAKKG